MNKKDVKVYKIFIFLFGMNLTTSMVHSQESIDSLVNHIESSFSSRPSESIYFQTSKDIYTLKLNGILFHLNIEGRVLCQIYCKPVCTIAYCGYLT